MKKFLTFSSILTILTLASCVDKTIVYEESKNFDGETWERDSTILFDFTIEDTNSVHLVSSFVRNFHDYQYCNLYLNYSIADSNAKVLKTSVKDLSLYSPKTGEPLGETEMFANAQTGHYLLDTLKFPYAGKYHISIQHHMRDLKSLDNIQSIGVQVKSLK